MGAINWAPTQHAINCICTIRDVVITGAINYAPTHGDQSRLNLHHISFIAKRVQYLARSNHIDGKYHAITHQTYPAIHCVLGRGPIYRARCNHFAHCNHCTIYQRHIISYPSRNSLQFIQGT